MLSLLLKPSSNFVRLLFSSFLDVHASDDLQGDDHDVVLASESWSNHYGVAAFDLLRSQRKWDELLCEVAFKELHVDAAQWDLCRPLSAKSAHSAAWSEVMPIPVLENLLGAEELRVAVTL